MQEVMNRILETEQKAHQTRTEAQNNAKSAQLEAARQGKDLLDKARKNAGERARNLISDANADAEAALAAADQRAKEKAEQLKSECADKIRKASEFVVERIVDGV